MQEMQTLEETWDWAPGGGRRTFQHSLEASGGPGDRRRQVGKEEKENETRGAGE